VSEVPLVWDLPAHLRWLIDEVIALGSVSLICSESGIGKTWLAYFVAGCVATGAPFLGRRGYGTLQTSG
jgi:RecA-family ATPase